MLYRVLAALSGESFGAKAPWRQVNPYRGLEVMTEADADYFFGRTAETTAVMTALANKTGRCPILIGGSGVGKSSIARAGVLSALKLMRWPATDRTASWPKGLHNSREWAWVTIRPGDAPLDALAGAITRLWLLDVRDPTQAVLPRKWASDFASGELTLPCVHRVAGRQFDRCRD